MEDSELSPRWQIDARQISFDESKPIGKGAFGIVWRGDYCGTAVAVKLLDTTGYAAEEEFRKYVKREMVNLCLMRHPNIVQFLGIATRRGVTPRGEMKEDLFLITEFMDGGDLSKLKDPSYTSNWKLRAIILRDVARAMVHIHKQDMMHRDLKSGNLLLSEDWLTTKVCDLGLARKVEGGGGGTVMTYSGTGPWVAPEVTLKRPYSFPADVFSYGMVIFELIFLLEPPRRLMKESFQFFPERFFAALPADVPNGLWELMCHCAQNDPDKRPSFLEVLKRMDAIVASISEEPCWSHDDTMKETTKKVMLARRGDDFRRKLRVTTTPPTALLPNTTTATAATSTTPSTNPSPIATEMPVVASGAIRIRKSVENRASATSDLLKKTEALFAQTGKSPHTTTTTTTTAEFPFQAPQQGKATEHEGGGMNGVTEKGKELNLPSWCIRYEDLLFEREVGEGAFGVVWKGSYAGRDIAIKKMSDDNDGDGGDDTFNKYVDRELHSLSQLRHPNVVEFVGAASRLHIGEGSLKSQEEVYLAMEYMEGGDLGAKLRDPSYSLNLKLQTTILRDVAKAMEYLHSAGVMHRDLKASNLLLSKDWSITKICDLGLARPVEAGNINMTISGSNLWMAPEVSLMRPYDFKADVFSFGMVMYEFLFSMDPPRRMPMESYLFVPERYEGGLAEDVLPDLWDLLCDCAKQQPTERPTFSEILKRLEGLLAVMKGEGKWDRVNDLNAKTAKKAYNFKIERIQQLQLERVKEIEKEKKQKLEEERQRQRKEEEEERRERQRKEEEEAKKRREKEKEASSNHVQTPKTDWQKGGAAVNHQGLDPLALKEMRKEEVKRLEEKMKGMNRKPSSASHREPRVTKPIHTTPTTTTATASTSTIPRRDDNTVISKEERKNFRKTFNLQRRREWRLEEDKLEIGEGEGMVLGVGPFGEVSKGRYKGAPVAVKKMRLDAGTDRDALIRHKEREIHSLKHLTHPNIIPFIGIILPSSSPSSSKNEKKKEETRKEGQGAYVITPLMDGGNLSDKVRDPAYSINWKKKISILKDIASALTYIHSKDMMHKDLKSRNVLLSEDWSQVKVCDIGMARSMVDPTEIEQNMTPIGTALFTAPEVLLRLSYTPAIDIFSFGLIMYEIIMGVYPPPRSISERYAFDPLHWVGAIPDDIPQGLWDLLCDCVKQDAEERPTFGVVQGRLDKIYNSIEGEDHWGYDPSMSEETRTRLQQTRYEQIKTKQKHDWTLPHHNNNNEEKESESIPQRICKYGEKDNRKILLGVSRRERYRIHPDDSPPARRSKAERPRSVSEMAPPATPWGVSPSRNNTRSSNNNNDDDTTHNRRATSRAVTTWVPAEKKPDCTIC